MAEISKEVYRIVMDIKTGSIVNTDTCNAIGCQVGAASSCNIGDDIVVHRNIDSCKTRS